MNDAEDSAVAGLLSDIAGGMAVLVERLDAFEAKVDTQYRHLTEALATIAEIAARTYFGGASPAPLPDEVVDANVMTAMIDRWPRGAPIAYSLSDRELLGSLDQRTETQLDAIVAHAVGTADRGNSGRLRREAGLELIRQEIARRAKRAQQMDQRETRGRGR